MNCTLFEAITTANDGSTQPGCVTGDGTGPDTIDLQTDVTLSSALPQITSPITLEGNGHTIDGANSARVLYVGNNGDLTLNNATITGGNANNGGGVYNYKGAVTLNNSVISSNSASNRGGGVYNFNAPMTLNNSVISGNSAISGGGVFNRYATMTLNNSAVSGNSASSKGGGVYNRTYATMTLNNSTVSGNSASYGGGIYNYYYSAITLNNSTVSGNSASSYGGGIHNYYDSVVNLNRSLISGNTGTAAEIYIRSGTVNADNANLLGDISKDNAAAFSGFTPGAADITATSDGTNPTALTSILDTTLSDNGGPTLTHALVSGSPAIDAAPTGAAPNGIDQRGAARDFDGDGSSSANEGDIGAFEFRESISAGNCTGADLSGAQTFNFTASANTLTVNVNNANGLKCITIEEMGPGVNHLLETGTGTGVGLQTNNWWHISGNINSGFNVDLTIPYGNADGNSRLCKWPGNLGGSGWDCDDGTNTTFVANTSVTRSGLTSFSDWAVGDKVGPTAVTLQDITAASGAGGMTAVFAALSLALGSFWLWLKRKMKAER